jgi:hypothetical protein
MHARLGTGRASSATSDAAKHSAARETTIAPFDHLERAYQDLMRPRAWARRDPGLTLTIKPWCGTPVQRPLRCGSPRWTRE